MMKSVSVVRPVPVTVTSCPGLADATPGSAGVPLSAVTVICRTSTTSGALVPPAVVTEIAPKASFESGSVRTVRELACSIERRLHDVGAGRRARVGDLDGAEPIDGAVALDEPEPVERHAHRAQPR